MTFRNVGPLRPSVEVAIRHNFESGHRLPHLPGKCQSLHGHSWWATITVAADTVDSSGVLLDFGWLKRHVREWIDTNLDHGMMLGDADPLREYLAGHGKVFHFTPDLGGWPTVENVALLLLGVTRDIIADQAANVVRVDVQETHVNAASWTMR